VMYSVGQENEECLVPKQGALPGSAPGGGGGGVMQSLTGTNLPGRVRS